MAGIYRNTWYITCKYCLSLLPDLLFHNTVGFIMHKRFNVSYHWMNIKKPKTFSEKINYLKTHPVVPNEAELADKYDVREFIKKTIGDRYLVPILGVWNNVDNINFDLLPKQFVLKLTKGSGYPSIIMPLSQNIKSL